MMYNVSKIIAQMRDSVRHIKISENDSNQRLDRFLLKYLPKASESLIQKYIRKKRIKVNKKRTSSSQILMNNDIINIYIYDEILEKYMEDLDYSIIKKINLSYIYNDDNVSVLFKESGVLSHGSIREENLAYSYLKDLIDKGEFNPEKEKSFTPALANRLDQGTSGLVIGGKNSSALRSLNKAIKERLITRKYRAIVVGEPKVELIDKKLHTQNNKTRLSPSGKESFTRVKVIKSNGEFSLLDLNLITGRTHQLRAHLAAIGCPIVGDFKYGNNNTNQKFKEKYGLISQYLIAYKINFQGLEGKLSYLNDKTIELTSDYYNKNLEKALLS